VHFSASEKQPKATIEIGGITYKVMSPTLKQSDKFADKFQEAANDHKKVSLVMKEYLSELGAIPVEIIESMDAELFLSVFEYVTTPLKKS
jgi:hypothetical protein